MAPGPEKRRLVGGQAGRTRKTCVTEGEGGREEKRLREISEAEEGVKGGAIALQTLAEQMIPLLVQDLDNARHLST